MYPEYYNTDKVLFFFNFKFHNYKNVSYEQDNHFSLEKKFHAKWYAVKNLYIYYADCVNYNVYSNNTYNASKLYCILKYLPI